MNLFTFLQLMESFTFWFIGCCAYGLCIIASVENHPAVQQGMLNNDAAYESGPAERSQGKRAIFRAAKGMAVVQKLLKGATKVCTNSKNCVLYKKTGDRQTALKDFYSVNPKFIEPKQSPDVHLRRVWWGQETLTGTAGDRRLILKPDGDGRSRYSPVLEIRSTSGAYYDRIVYKPTEN